VTRADGGNAALDLMVYLSELCSRPGLAFSDKTPALEQVCAPSCPGMFFFFLIESICVPVCASDAVNTQTLSHTQAHVRARMVVKFMFVNFTCIHADTRTHRHTYAFNKEKNTDKKIQYNKYEYDNHADAHACTCVCIRVPVCAYVYLCVHTCAWARECLCVVFVCADAARNSRHALSLN